jgi:hypothetical protein
LRARPGRGPRSRAPQEEVQAEGATLSGEQLLAKPPGLHQWALTLWLPASHQLPLMAVGLPLAARPEEVDRTGQEAPGEPHGLFRQGLGQRRPGRTRQQEVVQEQQERQAPEDGQGPREAPGSQSGGFQQAPALMQPGAGESGGQRAVQGPKVPLAVAVPFQGIPSAAVGAALPRPH